MLRKIMVGAALAALGSVGVAHAQPTDGTFGSTSTGTFSVTANIDPVVRVSRLDNLTFNIGAAFLNGSAPNINDRFNYCVYSNVGSAGTYKLSVNGGTPGSGNAWLLSGTEGTLQFFVNSNDGTTERQLGIGDQFTFSSAARHSARPNTADCSDTGENTQIIVAIRRADILAANAGSYSGTVQVIASAL
jgi:hypothetical protein